MDKSILRKEILRIRRQIPAEIKAEKSRKICEKILESAHYRKADTIYAFMPYNGEPDILPVIQDALKRGKTLLVPKVYGDIMEFIRIAGPEDLAPGAWGILEPVSDDAYPKGNPENEPERYLMLVPGTAFTEAGDRMGYGRGYYDKYLADFPIRTIGLCYEEQIVEELPTEDTDKKIAEIIHA